MPSHHERLVEPSRETPLFGEYEVVVVSTKHPGGVFASPSPETPLGANDLVVIAGSRSAVERFIRAV